MIYDDLSKIDFGDIYSKALKDYKSFDIVKDYEKLSQIEDERLKTFLVKYGQAILIPLRSVDGEIFGIIFRTVGGKDFYSWKLKDKPLVYGLEDFIDYSSEKPILLCEGIKDCLILKKVYPYSLAYLTSQPSDELMDFLGQLSSRLIIFPDNDKAGRKFEIRKDLKEKFKYHKLYYVPYPYKDLGEYFEGQTEILEWTKMVLKLEGLVR